MAGKGLLVKLSPYFQKYVGKLVSAREAEVGQYRFQFVLASGFLGTDGLDVKVVIAR